MHVKFQTCPYPQGRINSKNEIITLKHSIENCKGLEWQESYGLTTTLPTLKSGRVVGYLNLIFIRKFYIFAIN